MPLHDARNLLAELQQHEILPKASLQRLRPLAAQFPTAADLARELVYVTPQFDKQASETCTALPSAVGVLALSADGKRLAARLDMDKLRTWDVGQSTWLEIKTIDLLRLSGYGPVGLFAPDGKTVAPP